MTAWGRARSQSRTAKEKREREKEKKKRGERDPNNPRQRRSLFRLLPVFATGRKVRARKTEAAGAHVDGHEL